MLRILVGTFALVLATQGSLFAQNPQGRPAGAPPAAQAGGEVLGSVTDPEGEPLYGASVAVMSPADSSIVSGDIAGRDGSFRVQGLPPGTYYLHITSIGYDPRRTEEFAIGPQAPRADLGVQRLIPSPIAVEGIDVEVERPAMTLEPDRNVYAAKDVAPAAATASEVLAAVPAVMVDQDGRVSLRGNENVAVQINGRPAPIRGEQLGDYLRQLPANVIDRVEVVPTPSARHDPEGMAGIINIVLKQNTELGWSGGLTLGASPSERYNVAGTLGYQRGNWTSFSTYGFSADERSIEGINDRERFDDLSALTSITEQDVLGEMHNDGHNLTSTLDYKLSERDVLTNAVTMNLRGADDETVNDYTELDADGQPIDAYALPKDSETDGLVLEYTLALKRTIEPRRHELAAEMRLNRNDDEISQLIWRQPEESGAFPTELEQSDTDAVTKQLTAQFDYTRPLSENTKLETGYKGNARWLDREYLVLEDEFGTGDWVESDLSNTFDFDETVHAGYGVLTRGIGALEVQGGLRLEHANRDFVLADDGQSYPYSYGSVFPSAALRYTPNDLYEARLSYSRRIRRPGTQELNPFPVFMDVQNVFIGNPELDPEYTDAIELSLSRQAGWGMIQLSPFYRHTTDAIRFVVDTDDVIDDREVTSVTFENLDTGNSFGTDLNTQVEYGGWLNAMASFNIFRMVTEGGSESSLSSDAVTWSTRVNATARLSQDLTLQAMMFYRAPMEFETGKFSSWKMSSLTLRQELFGDRAWLALRVVDPFDTMGFRVEAGDENLFQITERKFDARSVHLTLQYNFGQAPRVRQPRAEDTPAPQTGFPQ